MPRQRYFHYISEWCRWQTSGLWPRSSKTTLTTWLCQNQHCQSWDGGCGIYRPGTKSLFWTQIGHCDHFRCQSLGMGCGMSWSDNSTLLVSDRDVAAHQRAGIKGSSQLWNMGVCLVAWEHDYCSTYSGQTEHHRGLRESDLQRQQQLEAVSTGLPRSSKNVSLDRNGSLCRSTESPDSKILELETGPTGRRCRCTDSGLEWWERTPFHPSI